METQRILVVDDEAPILFAIQEYFTAHGYAVDCARDAEEAKARVMTMQYALVITDLRLTGADDTQGLDVVSYVRERAPSTRIILLTAYGAPGVESEARRRGVDVLLNKPKPLPAVARIVFDLIQRPRAQGPREPDDPMVPPGEDTEGPTA